MKKIVIIGAGGHGQVVADILLRKKAGGAPVDPICFLDDDESLIGKTILGLRIKGSVNQLMNISHTGVVVAIGNNQKRMAIYNRLLHMKVAFFTACHPSAVIADDVHISDGCMICAGVIVNTGARIGANTILNTSCSVDHHNIIGDHVHIAPGAHLGGNVTVRDGVLIGLGSNILPGCTVGDGSLVGAGAMVTMDIPSHSTVFGVPARIDPRAHVN